MNMLGKTIMGDEPHYLKLERTNRAQHPVAEHPDNYRWYGCYVYWKDGQPQNRRKGRCVRIPLYYDVPVA